MLPAQNVAWGIVDRGNRKRLKVSRPFRAFDAIETSDRKVLTFAGKASGTDALYPFAHGRFAESVLLFGDS